MQMQARKSFILLFLLSLAGCLERQPAEFAQPLLGEVRVEAGFDAVHFEVAATGPWSECGVYFGESAGALRRIPGERTGTGFRVDVSGLEDEAEYQWRAFLGNGRDEICTDPGRVVTQEYPYVKLPDPAFRTWILARYDLDGDGHLSEQEALRIVDICSYEGPGARSLRGIECFPNLRSLIWANDSVLEIDLSANGKLELINLEHNLLTELDLSGCPRLETLICNDNHLLTLDLSPCPHLKHIACWMNNLTALDFSGLPELEDLACAQSDFSKSGLDVSKNPKLRSLWCNDSYLSDLDVSANPLLEELGCYRNPLYLDLDLTANPRLDTLEVSGCPGLGTVWLRTGCTPGRGITKDEHTQIRYSDAAPPVPIPDPGFKAYLTAHFDADRNGEISRGEARRIRRIEAFSDEWNIQSLKGIEYMPELTELRCTGSWIDEPVPDQPYYYQGHYRWDDCFGPAGTLLEVDVSHNPALTELNVACNAGLGEHMTSLDLRNNPNLEELGLGMTYLPYPDVSRMTKLKVLDLGHLRGTKPELSALTGLRVLILDFPQDDKTGYAVDVSRCPDLEELNIATAGSVSDLSKNPKLRVLRTSFMGLRKLDVSALARLEELACEGNYLETLDLSGNPQLKTLSCQDNRLRSLDVSANPRLGELKASPMNDTEGQNLLEILFVSEKQEIPGVTKDRSAGCLPAQTEIVRK